MGGSYRDPVHERDGLWYFYDETWANELGPYPTEDHARVALREYVRALDE